MALFNPDRSMANSLRTGQNVGVLFQRTSRSCFGKWASDRALAKIEETVRFARGLEHPFSLAMALIIVAGSIMPAGSRIGLRRASKRKSLLPAAWLRVLAGTRVVRERRYAHPTREYIAADQQLQPIYELIVASGCKSRSVILIHLSLSRTCRPID